MRWYILRTLLKKEIHRHLANRGGIALAGLLVVASLLLSIFGRDEAQASGMLGGVQHCFIDYWEEGPWVEHLKRNVPPELKSHVRFRSVQKLLSPGQTFVYPTGTGAIQLRPDGADGERPRYKVWFWHPGKEGSGLAVYEAWFWRETHAFLGNQSAASLETQRFALRGGMDARTGIATAMVLFALFFICVYLLPSLTCEERERGVLLAQALSPATPQEILAAKFLFYPAAGIGLAALLAGLNQPSVLRLPFFWLALGVTAFGSLGVGLTIASVARTQRAASMGALCYMMAVAMILFVCQQGNIPGVSYLALEYHCPRMLHACLTGSLHWYHALNLLAAGAISVAWAVAATVLFRRRGWQT